MSFDDGGDGEEQNAHTGLWQGPTTSRRLTTTTLDDKPPQKRNHHDHRIISMSYYYYWLLWWRRSKELPFLSSSSSSFDLDSIQKAERERDGGGLELVHRKYFLPFELFNSIEREGGTSPIEILFFHFAFYLSNASIFLSSCSRDRESEWLSDWVHHVKSHGDIENMKKRQALFINYVPI